MREKNNIYECIKKVYYFAWPDDDRQNGVTYRCEISKFELKVYEEKTIL